MKPPLLLLAWGCLLLSGCGTDRQLAADDEAVRESGVPSIVYERITHDEPLTLADIVALSQAHVSNAVIIRYVNRRNERYFLTREDIEQLQREGVAQNVIYTLRDSQPNFAPGGGFSPIDSANPALGPGGAGLR